MKKKWKGYILKVKKLLLSAFIAIYVMLVSTVSVFASGIASSKLATGTTKLIGDITNWIMILAIPITILLVIYFAIRKGAADEQDQKMWQKRITTALVCGIGAIIASSLVGVLASYYS